MTLTTKLLLAGGVGVAFLLTRSASAGAGGFTVPQNASKYVPVRVSGGKFYDRLGNQVTADGRLVVANGGYAIGDDGALAVPQRSGKPVS